jgi:hypothetical protein
MALAWSLPVEALFCTKKGSINKSLILQEAAHEIENAVPQKTLKW